MDAIQTEKAVHAKEVSHSKIAFTADEPRENFDALTSGAVRTDVVTDEKGCSHVEIFTTGQVRHGDDEGEESWANSCQTWVLDVMTRRQDSNRLVTKELANSRRVPR